MFTASALIALIACWVKSLMAAPELSECLKPVRSSKVNAALLANLHELLDVSDNPQTENDKLKVNKSE